MSLRLASDLLGGILGKGGKEVALRLAGYCEEFQYGEHLGSCAKCPIYLKQLSIQDLFH